MFLQSETAFRYFDSTAINAFDVGAILFALWRADIAHTAVELRRMRDELRDKQLKRALADSQRRLAELSARSALETNAAKPESPQ